MISASARITTCRACGGHLSTTFCDLGIMPVANSYLPREADLASEPRFPLCALVCDECRLVQLDTTVDAEGIFSDYAYFSSASSSWLAHSALFCTQMIQRLELGSSSWVVEAASNDGYLLRNFVARGIPCLGIEPSKNVADVARAAGVPTETIFLNAATATQMVQRVGRNADLVIANNVLAHVPDINGFVAGISILAGRNGVVSIEAPHLLRLVDGVQFDTIYHEHYTYWSFLAMERILEQHGLHPFDVERLSTHGGSLRVFASAKAEHATPALQTLREEEAQRGLANDTFYKGFDIRVGEVVASFRAWIDQMKSTRRQVAAYGAAAKGNTFLNAAGISAADIVAVADRSPAKQGRLLPGSHIPVVSPTELLELEPDEILVLPWNIVNEIAADLRAAGFAGGIHTALPQMRSHP